MQMNRRAFLMANLVLALCLSGCATQKQEVGGEVEIPTSRLVNTIRLLALTEVAYHTSNGRFASQEELLAFSRPKNLLGKSPLDLENPAPYQVRITTDPNGTHYQMTIKRLYDPNDKSTPCRTATFSDDSGVIFLGQGITCPAAPQ